MENLDTQYGQMNFNLPHDVVILPSKGIFYKNKKKSVKVGYLTAADENILLASENNDLIMNLLRSKVYEPDLRPEDLLNGDIEAILIFLRNTSFGPEYNISAVDPKTSKKFDAVIALDSLDIVKPEVEPDENGFYITTLPKSNMTVKLKPLTYRERNEIEKNAETYPKNRTAPVVTWRLQKQIVEINGSGDLGEISKNIEVLPIMDSKHIRNFMLKNEPRLDLSKEIVCPSGERINVQINFGPEFFRPFF
jgi:hypothetical protein